jgi:branched-chain amino acid transport system ATP-binding protein
MTHQIQPGQPMLRCDQVRVRFGAITALDGVSFEVAAGQIVGIIGPNGAGKTTLFNCISRLYPIHGGDILLDGRSLLSEPQHRIANLGIMRTFQNVALFASDAASSPMRCGYPLRHAPTGLSWRR